MVEAVQSAGFHLRPEADFDDAFHHVMTSAIEPKIGKERPCVIEKWPRQMAGLSKICADNPLLADRFEIYFMGLEIANAFAELTDPVEQRRRFEQDLAHKLALGKDLLPINDKFLKDLAFMPPSVGIAVGFDRLLLSISGLNQIENIHPLTWF